MPGEQRVFVSHVTSGPSMVLCVQRSNGVRKLLELAGPLNPRSNGSGDICRIGAYTLREEFGIDEFSNAVHGNFCAWLLEIADSSLCSGVPHQRTPVKRIEKWPSHLHSLKKRGLIV